MKNLSFLDSVYGYVTFDEDITALAASPVLQRLRHVRLSNIDSLSMPGIANLSRYEHVLGVAHLASQIGFSRRLSHEDRIAVIASALLHDWAITSFGHLVEEAFKYVGTGFDHENRLYEIIAGEVPEEIGGIERQIFRGRQTKLIDWAQKIVGRNSAANLLQEITNYIQGHGRFGRLICGDIDLDNIDSVFRMAFHMGLPLDRDCPLRLAHAIVDTTGQNGRPIFQLSARPDIEQWLTVRRAVYERLMLANLDFIGKIMIVSATVSVFEKDEIGKLDWNLTDDQLLQRLLDSSAHEVKETAERWLVGDLWDATPLYWMSGKSPELPKMLSFSKELSFRLSRQCFAYSIKDKRSRLLRIHFTGATTEEFGSDSFQWLFGVGSSKRSAFKRSEISTIVEFAQSYFNTSVISLAHEPQLDMKRGGDQGCLL